MDMEEMSKRLWDYEDRCDDLTPEENAMWDALYNEWKKLKGETNER